MLVLEATNKRQGERSGDYHWCNDGELAYNPGVSCARIDCGCERGWAGLDSHQATTTVQVVDRPDMTVANLAAELAAFLFDNGWISTNDPQNELVVAHVDETVEMVNQFGEGAVLERDGEWIRERDGSNEAVNPLNRLALEELTEDILISRPMDTIGKAMALLASSTNFETALLDALVEAGWPEAQALGCAIDWLHHGRPIYEWTGIPRWLENLDQAEITEARRCKGNDSDGYLLTIEFDGELLGIASVCIKHEGHIHAFFAVYDDAQTHIRLLKNLQRRNYRPFRKVAPQTALRAIRAASNVPVPEQTIVSAFSWVPKRPLLDFITQQMSSPKKVAQ